VCEARPCGSGAGPVMRSRRPNWPPSDAGPYHRARPCPSTWRSCPGLLEASAGEEGGRIDLETGEVWHASTIDCFAEQRPEEAPDFDDPDQERWYRFSNERQRGRARQWLSFAGYGVAVKTREAPP
jgi:hypothetical protein